MVPLPPIRAVNSPLPVVPATLLVFPRSSCIYAGHRHQRTAGIREASTLVVVDISRDRSRAVSRRHRVRSGA
jgi:hypothetical protein